MLQQTDHFDEIFAPFAQKMAEENLPEIAVKTFAYYYRQLLEGKTGLIAEKDILPIESLPDAEGFGPDLAAAGKAALAKTVLMKLNGGLGTSMGLERAKSLLTVKNGLSFLDIIARQAIHAKVSLVLMDSFATQADSLAALTRYPELQTNIPLDFLQHKIPKINQAALEPVQWPRDPEHEWCPPGHGDIYTALLTSGMLDALLEAGYEYAFISNADNLGAVIDAAILGYFAQNRVPFMMEAADRTEADKKGGHLARLLDGQLILRENAQCAPEDENAYQDISRHKFFNTNNLWLNLPALKAKLVEKENILGLTMIRNAKTVDPRDPASTPVYQLETAMGAAIAVFPEAQAIRVPRTRFAPVKTTNDLLAVRSDAYILTDDFRIISSPERKLPKAPIINLDSAYYKLIRDMEARFPYSAPSLVNCERLTVKGDIKFGKNITLMGRVELINQNNEQIELDDGTVIESD